MTAVAFSGLGTQTRALLDRAAAGEEITIPVDGRPLAMLGPLAKRSRWMPRDTFLRDVLPHGADPALRAELDVLAPDTTDYPSPGGSSPSPHFRFSTSATPSVAWKLWA